MPELKYSLFGLFLSLITIQASFAMEQENTLSFKDVVTDKESRDFKILDLELQETGVRISATKGKSCFLAYDEFISDWVAEGKCRGDAHVATAYDEEVEAVKEFFSNAKNYKITCSFRDEQIVGYSFKGHTVIEGETSLVYRAKAFDLSQYPMPEPEKPPGAIVKLLKKTFGVLDKIFRGY